MTDAPLNGEAKIQTDEPLISAEQLKSIHKADVANLVKKVRDGKTLSVAEAEKLEAATRRSKRTSALGTAATMRSAATMLGVSVSLIKAAKNAGCQAWRANGTIECDVLRDFITQDFIEQQSDLPNKDKEDALLVRARREMSEHLLRVKQREVIPIDEVKRDCFRFVGMAKTKLLSMETNATITASAEFKLTAEQQQRLREIIRSEAGEFLTALEQGEWFK